jgi:hypothetical protein
MSTNTFYRSEMGIETAQPVWAVKFAAMSGSPFWCYTTAPFDVVYADDTYIAEPGLVIGSHEVTENEQRALRDITVRWGNSLLQTLLAGGPDEPIRVTIYKGHVDSTYAYQVYSRQTYGNSFYGGHAFIAPWTGWLLGHEFQQKPKAVLKCTPWWTDMGRTGSCLRSGRRCGVALGSTACGVDLTLYDAHGRVMTVSGDTVTAAVFALQADGYYANGGKLVRDIDGAQRMIISHTGTTVILSHALATLAVDDAITVTPGCDHIWDGDCKTRYANQIDFRGQPNRATVNLHARGLL